MEGYFFKPRKNFDFNPNEYDLGIPFWQTKTHLDMHFLNKIVKLDVSKHWNLYEYHKNYYLETKDKAVEEVFFRKLLKIVEEEKERYNQKDPRKISPREKQKLDNKIEKYEAFIKMLRSNDKWGITTTDKDKLSSIGKDIRKNRNRIDSLKEDTFNQLKKELESLDKIDKGLTPNQESKLDSIVNNLKETLKTESLLQKENKRLREEFENEKKRYNDLNIKFKRIYVKPGSKINIKEGHFGTFISLIKNLQKIKEPNTSNEENQIEKILQTGAEKTWLKLISNNFTSNGKSISIKTLENYFYDDRELPKKGYYTEIVVLPKKIK